MTTIKIQKQRDLGQEISEYWRTYGTNLDLPRGQFRTWINLPLETQKVLQEKIYSLIKISADFENILTSESTNLTLTPFCPQTPLSVRWGGRVVLIFPWLDLRDMTESQFSSFCESLPKNTLSIATIPHLHTQTIGEMVQRARSSDYTLILAAPDDIDALAKMAWTLTEFINYKVTRIYLEGGVDADAVFLEWQVERFRQDSSQLKAKELQNLKTVIAGKKEDRTSWLRHPRSDDLAAALRTNILAFLVGESASGKTILALSVAERLEAAGKTVWYVDIGNLTSKRTVAVGMSIFREAQRLSKKVIVILDDLHTQPHLAKPLLFFLLVLQATLLGDQLSIVGICWPEFQLDIMGLLHDGYVLPIKASSMHEAMIRKFGHGLDKTEVDRIREQAGDDLFILRLWLENSMGTQILDINELARRVWIARSKNLRGSRTVLQRVTFVAYLIGQFECDVPEPFLEIQAGANSTHINELIRAKLLTKKGDSLSPPHRSFARLMAIYLGQNKDIWVWFQAQGFARNTGEIFVRYLEAIDPSQIWSALKLIERGGVIEPSRSSQEHIRMIMHIWSSVDALLQKMEEQQAEDPSWGHTISSSFFACQALCTVGKYKEAQGSIEFIRDCYSVSDGKFEIDVQKLSTMADFVEIRKRLELEELEGSFPTQYGLETSKQVDIDLIHANWASGLALGAEAYMRTLGDERLRDLAIAVEKRVEVGGYFYPARVPWVSARLLMGLSLCGRSIDNSPVIKKVAEWLLKDREHGGARDGLYWLPGTDGWNSLLETTAMVIIALRSVGVTSDNSVLRRATDWCMNQKAEWISPGSEMDGAIALEAYLSMTGNWSEVRREALYLAHWANAIALWRNATESAQRTQEQSCRAAATGAFLIKVMWSTLRDDVPQLLVAFGIGEDMEAAAEKSGSGASSDGDSYEWEIAISYASENGDYVDKVAHCLEMAGIRVFYDRLDLVERWGKDLYIYLDEVYRKKARYCVMFLSADYAMKAWTNHQRQSAQARAFQENEEYILPVRFDNTEIPGILPTIGYIDAEKVTPRELCKMIQVKLAAVSSTESQGFAKVRER